MPAPHSALVGHLGLLNAVWGNCMVFLLVIFLHVIFLVVAPASLLLVVVLDYCCCCFLPVPLFSCRLPPDLGLNLNKLSANDHVSQVLHLAPSCFLIPHLM